MSSWTARGASLIRVVPDNDQPHRATPANATTASSARRPSAGNVFAEHRYRIIGKLRLALFWIGRDDVGSARMTWRSDGTTNELTLLVGSDPQHAPRSLNQWGYLREEVRADHAEVFSLRSLRADDKPPATGFAVGNGPQFGASCSSVNDREVSNTRTTVNAPGVTFRMFDELLDRVAVSPTWDEKQMRRPPGVDAGFLTALHRAINADQAGDARTVNTHHRVAYVYNSGVYDLTLRDNGALGRTKVEARTFEQLTQADFSVRNRTTGELTKFGVTYAPDSSGNLLPVQIFYQPSFWLRVELRLDDEADAPPDPAGDGALLARMRDICLHSAR